MVFLIWWLLRVFVRVRIRGDSFFIKELFFFLLGL